MLSLSKFIYSCIVALIFTASLVKSENIDYCSNFENDDIYLRRHWDCVYRITNTYYTCDASDKDLFDVAIDKACCQSEGICQLFTDDSVEGEECKDDIIATMVELAEDDDVETFEICKYDYE